MQTDLIKEFEKFGDIYKLLEAKTTISVRRLKKHYLKLARIWHPDKNKAANAAEVFKKIKHGYDILKNPEKREKYDMYLRMLRSKRERIFE